MRREVGPSVDWTLRKGSERMYVHTSTRVRAVMLLDPEYTVKVLVPKFTHKDRVIKKEECSKFMAEGSRIPYRPSIESFSDP